MFDVDAFLDRCQAAVAEPEPRLAIRDVRVLLQQFADANDAWRAATAG